MSKIPTAKHLKGDLLIMSKPQVSTPHPVRIADDTTENSAYPIRLEIHGGKKKYWNEPSPYIQESFMSWITSLRP